MTMQSEDARPGVENIGGKDYMRDAKGALMPISLVAAKDILIDQEVRKIIGFACDLSDQVARFRVHTSNDVGNLLALVAQEYGTDLAGKKGNLTLTSYDGTMRVMVRVADQLEFGPELQAAKRLVDACLGEWAAGSRDEIIAIVNRAFDVDKEGTVNRSALFMLLRVAIEDAKWQEAMRAIRESIRVIGSKTYYQFQQRDTSDGEWRPITIDLARA